MEPFYSRETATQIIANDLFSKLWTHFRQPESNLFYMHIDAYEPGRINLPTVEQVKNSVPNSNGFGTPIENSNHSSSLILNMLITRYSVTRKRKHAQEARMVFEGLYKLWEISSNPGFVPRGIMPDMKTHYRDTSIDQVSFWIMAMWSYYRSDIASVSERKKIRRAIVSIAITTERQGWRFCREDGKITFWGDLRRNCINTQRAPLVHLVLLAITYDIGEDSYWKKLYHKFCDLDYLKELEDSICNMPTWVTQQTAWLLRTLMSLDSDEQTYNYYGKLLSSIVSKATISIGNFKKYDGKKAWEDFEFLSLTFRDVIYGVQILSLCADAQMLLEHMPLAEEAIRLYNYTRDAKIDDTISPIVHYYWMCASRGLHKYDPKLDGEGDSSIIGIPYLKQYKLHPSIIWFDSLTRKYHAKPPNEINPLSQFEFTGAKD